jgi:hypothetical protein
MQTVSAYVEATKLHIEIAKAAQGNPEEMKRINSLAMMMARGILERDYPAFFPSEGKDNRNGNKSWEPSKVTNAFWKNTRAEKWRIQGGRCAICRKKTTLGGRDGDSAALDHCHAKHRSHSLEESIRDILCSSCNWGLGQFQDSEHLLVRAAKYIVVHRTGGFVLPDMYMDDILATASRGKHASKKAIANIIRDNEAVLKKSNASKAKRIDEQDSFIRDFIGNKFSDWNLRWNYHRHFEKVE